MYEVPVFDVAGKQLGKEKVDPKWFGGIVRRVLLHDAANIYQGNQRAGTHNVKERGDVAGSKKKPWKQKHTGRARAGTKRSPIWVKGGVVFGPHPRDYSRDLPKQMKRLALDSALLSKFRDGEAALVDGLRLEKPQTKAVAGALSAIGVKESCLIGTEKADDQGRRLWLSARNIPRVHALPVSDLNALDVLKYRRLLLTRDAFNALVKNRRDGTPLPGFAPKAEAKPAPAPKPAAAPKAAAPAKPAAKPAPKKEQK
jgi:large subunit ribosomal protein L4